MSRPFLGRFAIVDIIKSKERTNAIQKRAGLTEYPVRFTVCGCPDPNCGGWHEIDIYARKIPSKDECIQILHKDKAARRAKKHRMNKRDK